MMQNSLEEKQIEVLLDIHTKKLRKDIQELREELSQVKSDIIRELKEVRGVKQDTPQQPVREERPSTEKQFEAPTPSPKKKESSEPIDRNGVSPDEVSIEKIFYVGTN